MKIALASPHVASTLDAGLAKVDVLIAGAAAGGAAIVCFPEAYLPGLRGLDFAVPDYGPDDEQRVMDGVSASARAHHIAVIAGMERITGGGREIAAAVFDAAGGFRGWQGKNQLDPSEEWYYVPSTGRRLFEIDGLRFGITICHEGWRYPEAVRWAAQRGAHVVFHPQHTGSHSGEARLTTWGAAEAPYYERAMMMRSVENTIYFASVNYALPNPDSATSVIAPDGTCEAYLPYGSEGVLIVDLDLARATGLLARRFAPERHHSADEA